MLNFETVEGGVVLDPLTGTPSGLTGKITFREPEPLLRQQGFTSADSLMRIANQALIEQGFGLVIARSARRRLC
jgi:hypothetical protein